MKQTKKTIKISTDLSIDCSSSSLNVANILYTNNNLAITLVLYRTEQIHFQLLLFNKQSEARVGKWN